MVNVLRIEHNPNVKQVKKILTFMMNKLSSNGFKRILLILMEIRFRINNWRMSETGSKI